MSQGLPQSDVVNVSVVMTPIAAALRNFGSLLILGSTQGVIDTTERMRVYSDLNGVGEDLGTDSPEYQAASLYYGQSPQPQTLYIGFYAQTASAGRLLGGIRSVAQQSLAAFTAVTNGSISLHIDGSVVSETGIDLSASTNLNGAASALTTALSGQGTVVWDANQARFILTSATTGSASSVSFTTAPGSGTDVGPLFGFDQASGGRLAPGSAIETALQGVTACANFSPDWYGLAMAPVTALADSDHLAIAAFIEAQNPARKYGITSNASAILDPSQTDDLASSLQALSYRSTFIQYSSSNAYAAVSFFGRAFTVDFEASNSTITMKFKQEPGVTPENLTENQAQSLNSKNCNVYAAYSNSTAIIQQGVMCGGFFFDEVHGLDWLQNRAQTDIFNVLLTQPKIPQTDPGVNLLLTAMDGSCEAAVTNGLVAPGVWGGPPIGALKTGQTLSKGYYNYAAPVANQSPADRAARKAPVLQSAVKLAGAVHFSDVVINVNR